MKLKFWKTCHCDLDSFAKLKDFYDKIGGDINERFLIFYNETCQHWKDQHKVVNQYFPNDQCMVLYNHSKYKIDQWTLM